MTGFRDRDGTAGLDMGSARAVQAWFARIRLARWAHFLLLPLATFDRHGGSDALFAAARGVASAFTILAFGYLLNSVTDRRMDLDARKNPFILPGAGEHRYSLTGVVVVGLVLAALAPWPARIAALTSLVLGSLYSVGPRLKSIPIIGTLGNIGNFTPLLFVGMASNSLPPRFAYLALTFTTLLLQNQLIHEAGDAIEDRGGGVRTTWLVLGPTWTSLIAAGIGVGAAVSASYLVSLHPWSAVTPIVGAIFGLAFPLLLAQRGTDPLRAAHLRIEHRGCALLVGTALFAIWCRVT
jgi:4-hydroxybenzoate polyprenyltransferase